MLTCSSYFLTKTSQKSNVLDHLPAHIYLHK